MSKFIAKIYVFLLKVFLSSWLIFSIFLLIDPLNNLGIYWNGITNFYHSYYFLILVMLIILVKKGIKELNMLFIDIHTKVPEKEKNLLNLIIII